SLYGLWLSNPAPQEPEIERALQGNLCRCTGYAPIVRAAEALPDYGDPASDVLRAERARITRELEGLRDGNRVEMPGIIVPADVDDLATVLEAWPDATIVAGATDVGLWVTKFMRDIGPTVFIGGLEELQTIEETDGEIVIGAGVSYTSAFALLSARIPAMGALLNRIGGEQIRNMGTIGGNIANGSPIGDTPPPLIALGARLTLRKGSARRTIPLEDFFIDYGKQDRAPGEFVERIHVPLPEKGARFAVWKVSKRRDEDITAVLGAFNIKVEGEKVVSARIAYGGMAATPKRAAAVEA